MSYSNALLPGDGSNTLFSFNFPYLEKAHVTAEVNGELVPFTWLNDSAITITPAPAAGTVVRIKRVTPKNQPPVDFSDGSVLKASDLDLLALFNLYCAQEAQDGVDGSVAVNASGVLDGKGRSTTGFANPTDPTGLLTRAYFETAYVPQMDAKVTAALGSAMSASTSASTAQGYAALADDSADTAAALLGAFRGQYMGALATAPTVDGNGQPLTAGDLYFSTTDKVMKVFTGTVWQSAGSTVQGTLNKPTTPVVAAAGQTSVNVPGGFDAGLIVVFLNGVAVSPPDVDVSGSPNIVFTSPLVAGDEVSWLAFGAFNVANATPAAGSVGDASVDPISKLYSRLNGTASVKDFGAKGDGATDDSVAIAACVAYCATRGKTVYFPSGTYLTTTITLGSNAALLGENPLTTTIKLKNGVNASTIQSSTAQSLALTGSFDLGDVGISIVRLTVDGNMANNTSAGDKDGCGILIYGERPVLREVYVKNTAGHGILTDATIYGAPAGDFFGMEGHFERVVIDTVKKHGWYFNGPHDSTSSHVLVIDASQAADNVWSGLYLNTPARFVSYHGWTRSVGGRHRYAANIVAGGGGSQFIASQFEGAVSANVNLLASGCFFDSTCAYYAAFGGINIFMGGTCTGNNIRGGIGASPNGYPNPVGVSISNTGADYVKGNNLDLMMAQQLSSNIYFGAGNKGGNTIKINAYQTAGSRYSGTPHSSDVVEISMYGSSNVSYSPLRPVAYVTFDGTVATPTLSSSYNVSSVTKTGTGAYTINFANPISPGASMLGTSESTKVVGRPYGNSPTVQDVRVATATTGAGVDSALVTVMFFAN